MRYLCLTLFCLGALFVNAQEEAQDVPPKKVEATFDQMFIDLGTMKRGDTRDTVFTFTNTGKEDLEIEIASGCECTTLDWTRGVVAPNEQGIINVHFDSTEKETSQTIELDVDFKNTNPETGGPYFIRLEYTFEFED